MRSAEYSAFRTLHSALSNGSHPSEIRREGHGSVPGVWPVDQERLADQQVALHIVVIFGDARSRFEPPEPGVGALGTIVAQRQKLVGFEREFVVSPVLI